MRRRPASWAWTEAMRRMICDPGPWSSRSRSNRSGAYQIKAGLGSSAPSPATASGGDELIPLSDHVVVLVHHGVPACNGAHAVLIRSAVTLGSRFLENGAIWTLDIFDCRLAFH